MALLSGSVKPLPTAGCSARLGAPSNIIAVRPSSRSSQWLLPQQASNDRKSVKAAFFKFGGQKQEEKQQAATPAPPPKASYPASYDQAVRQAQIATQAALADGLTLLEVEFPSTSLTSVAGDGEGQNEMNESMQYLRQYVACFRQEPGAAKTRVFFPDSTELRVAKSGQTADPSAGRKAFDAVFDNTDLKFGYLTKQNAVWGVLGVNFDNWTCADLVKDTDKLFVVAYPSFNPREEMSAVKQLWEKKAKPAGLPIVIFNGELDRLRGGYYPSLFFPELAKISSELLPKFEAAYYLKNFKGTKPGALFRAYPGPWQVYRRNPLDPQDMRLVWEGEQRPTLKEVALEILTGQRKSG